MKIAICKSTKEMCEMPYNDEQKCRIDCALNATEPLCYFCYEDTDKVFCCNPNAFPDTIDKYCETESQLILLIARSKNENFRTRAKYVLRNNILLIKRRNKG